MLSFAAMAVNVAEQEFVRPPFGLIPGLEVQSIPKGKMLFSQGDPVKRATFIFDGVVLLEYQREPKRETRGRNDFFRLIPAEGLVGYEAFMERVPKHLTSAKAITPLVVQHIPLERVNHLLLNPNIRGAVTNALLGGLMQSNEQAGDMRTMGTAEGYLAIDAVLETILQLRSQYPTFPSLVQEVVAGLVGTSRESTNKRIRQLEEKGSPLAAAVRPPRTFF